MGRNPWDDESGVPAFARRGSGSTRWGRVFVGVVVVAAATFVGAYYLPLFRAHDVLTAEHRRTSEQAETLQRTLTSTQAELKAVKARRDELEAERQQRESRQASAASDLDAKKSELSQKVDRFAKKGLAQVAVRDGNLVVALADSILFAAHKLDVSASGKQLLCDVAKSSNKGFAIHAVQSADDNDPQLSDKYPGPWELRAARAAAIAEALESKCGSVASGLRIELDDAAGAAAGSLPATRIEIVSSRSSS